MRSLTGTLVHGIQVFRSLFRVGVRLVGNGLEQLEASLVAAARSFLLSPVVVMVTMVSIMNQVSSCFSV